MEFSQISLQDLQLPHDLVVNVANGSVTASINIPVPIGRGDFKPTLQLQYSSFQQKSIFGIGWNLSGTPFISLDIKKGLPKYDSSDTYSFNGGISLSPELILSSTEWIQRVEEFNDHWIYYFRTKQDRSFIRFEKWVHKTNASIHWRTMSADNVLSIYGTNQAIIHDPEKPENIFIWMLVAKYDQLGNMIQYEYKSEDAEGVNIQSSFEKYRINDFLQKGFTQKYLIRILYGNTIPLFPNETIPNNNQWLFKVVFDYGDFEETPYQTDQPDISKKWIQRKDPFSVYKPGFEIRTYRLCKRILTYHHIQELSPIPSLTGIFTANYEENEWASLLKSVQYTGVRKELHSGNYTTKQLPPISIQYSKPNFAQSFENVPIETIQNTPLGFLGSKTKFIDLFGDGLPGLLTEETNHWYYKKNRGNGLFDQQEIIIQKPSQLNGIYSLGDFDHDGNPNLFSVLGQEAGYYEYDKLNECWGGYKTFRQIASVQKGKFIDINADGFADLLIEQEDKITCFPFFGKDGFGTSYEFSKPASSNGKYSNSIGKDLLLDHFMADMTGDGLPDQVIIRNGSVSYYPNLGNGRFGKEVVMEDAPYFDYDSLFDASRIRLYDLNGTGISDIIYLGKGEISYWYNQMGNSFQLGGSIKGLPIIDLLSTAIIIDFLGKGTPCLVWSSISSQNAYSIIQYLEITNGIQPGAIELINNGMGLETSIEYGFSATHYLDAIKNNIPWSTTIPNHFRVVNKKTLKDTISNSIVSAHYKYYDGNFNGKEKKFTCFGRVEEYDIEFQLNDSMHHSISKCTKTWLHSGIFGWDKKQTLQFYNKDVLQISLPAYAFGETEILDADEFTIAYQTLSGKTIRQEVYAVDENGNLNEHPFTVAQNKYTIQKLQRGNGTYDAIFGSYQSETIAFDYEQYENDPRIIHQMVIETDSYGNFTKDLTIAYGRRNNGTSISPLQTKNIISCNVNKFINLNDINHFKIAIPLESKSFELNGITHQPNELIKWSHVKNEFNQWINNSIEFDKTFSSSALTTAKLINWKRIFYWNDLLNDRLPFGEIGNKILLHQESNAVFNDSLLRDIYQTKIDHFEMDHADFGYEYNDQYWWINEAITWYNDKSGFYTPKATGQINAQYIFSYDPYFLNIIHSIDPVNNQKSCKIDYNIIQPHQIFDVNDNMSEVRYDALGMAYITSQQGSVLHQSTIELYGNDLLINYQDPTNNLLLNIINHPTNYLQGAYSFLDYDLFSTPIRTIHLTRESLVYDGKGSNQPNSEIQIEIHYQDGFGRDIQTKVKVEAGEVIQRDTNNEITVDAAGIPILQYSNERWWVSGVNIYNSKQLPLEQYEPYFSDSYEFENEQTLQGMGISAKQFYDALGRLVKVEYPNGTFSEVKFESWKIEMYDQNDTVDRSMFQIYQSVYPNGSLEKKILDQTLSHKNTPTVIHLNPLAKEIIHQQMNNNGTEKITTKDFDNKGNIMFITDAKNLLAFEYKYDMVGRLLYENSMDAGEKWNVYNALNQNIHCWDSKNIHQKTTFDSVNRITEVSVEINPGNFKLIEKYIYGNDVTLLQTKEKNIRDSLVLHYDNAGIQELKLAAPGNLPLEIQRTFAENYSNEIDWTNPTAVQLQNEVFTSNFIYDALARVIQQRLPDEITRNFTFNKSGKLSRIVLDSTIHQRQQYEIIKEVTYNANGFKISTLFGNDIRSQFEYHSQTQLLERAKLYKNGVLNQVYQDNQYKYDPVGNLIYQVDHSQQTTQPTQYVMQGLNVSSHTQYEYDALYQLTKAEGRVHQALQAQDFNFKGNSHVTLNNAAAIERYTRQYEYDISGNKTNIRHRSPSNNWVQQFWTDTLSNRTLPDRYTDGTIIQQPENFFDQNGNCLYIPHARQVVWNVRNNISKIVLIDRSSIQKENDEEYYIYDATGKRLRKITKKLIDVNTNQLEIIEKLYLDGCVIKKITRGGIEILHRITSKINDGLNDICLIHHWKNDIHQRETDQINQVKFHYQIKNQLGSTSLELNELGNVISYEEYFPFGTTSFIAGNSAKNIKLKEYRYIGKEYDDLSGLYYFGYRYYAPWIGGWMSTDPIGPEDDNNLYLYVQNNPINLVDPNGLQSSQVQIRMLSTTAGLPPELTATMSSNGHVFFVEGMEVNYDYSFEEVLSYAREHNVDIQLYDTATTNRFFQFLRDPSDQNYASYRNLLGDIEEALETQNEGVDLVIRWHEIRSEEPPAVEDNETVAHGSSGTGSCGTGNQATESGSSDSSVSSTEVTNDHGNEKSSNHSTGANETEGGEKGGTGNTGSNQRTPNTDENISGNGTDAINQIGVESGEGTGYSNGNPNGTTNLPLGANGTQGEIGPGGRGSESATGSGRNTSGGANPNGRDIEPNWWQSIILAIGGALYTVANIFIEAGKQVYDMLGLGISCIGIATGAYEYEHEVVSGIGIAAEQGNDTGDILLAMGRNIIETPSRLINAAERGDYFEFGAECMNLYMIGRSAVGIVRGAPTLLRGIGNFGRNSIRSASSFFRRGSGATSWNNFRTSHSGMGATTGSGPSSLARGYAVRNSPVRYTIWRAGLARRFVAQSLGRIAQRMNPLRFSSNQFKGVLGRELARVKSYFMRETLIGREIELRVNGIRTIADLVVMDEFGFIKIIEAKFGPHSQLTPAQIAAWSGGSVSFRIEAFWGSKVKVP